MTASAFKPKLICNLLTTKLQALMVDLEDNRNYDILTKPYNELLNKGWQIYVVDQSRGACYGSRRVITVPKWAMNRDTGYIAWYLAHEMAHAYAGVEAKHGPIFMHWLKLICPPKHIHHELGYKPANAMAAGIAPEDF